MEMPILHPRYWDMKVSKFKQLYNYLKVVVKRESSTSVGEVLITDKKVPAY